ncbi:carbonic anhydrase [Micromonospora sp. HM5-17]|jgi:carbonic anhydrase|uniref:carbonic anhydrase n=1 Tax=Micromonospora sp. HM5-17 TaxID=2487710 RepID=UPI000F4A5804|nr:carbonic anhydrase [Micromonospora sp. HM5-17]ROT29542.1 carbonic anhydrase [Micromonospora sp. HM5-17]
MAYLDDRPTTPADALATLLAGNERFVTGTRIHPHQDAEHRAAVAAAQRPFAVIFGCSDSRLAAEIIFDRGLGDLFVVRTAGHIIGVEVTASIEYGVAVLGAPLVVVLGHDSCGAIQATHAAMGGARPPGRELGTIAERVAPSIWRANAEQVTDEDEVGRIHVRRTVETLTRPGTGLGEAVAAGRCDVVGMVYRLAEGRVSVLAAEAVRE